MRRFLFLLALVVGAAAIALPATGAGSPDFINSATTATVCSNTVTVTGKETGLGDEAQVHIVVTATAECINPGQNRPRVRTGKASLAPVTSRFRTGGPTSRSR